MNTLIVPPYADSDIVLRCRPPAIYVNGERYRELQLSELEILPAPMFGKAVLTLTGSRLTGPSQRLGDPIRLPPIGAKVKIRVSPHAEADLFVGYVAAHSFTVDEQCERFEAECLHQLVCDLGRRISGLWQFDGQSAVEVRQSRIRFNSDRNTLASGLIVTVNGRECRVFDSGAEAIPWSVGDALGYLLAASVPSDVEVPSLPELKSLAGEIDLGRMEVTGKTVGEALTEVARRGGLEPRSSRYQLGLVFYRPGKQGKCRNVRLQPAGSELSPEQSNLWRGRIDIRRRSSQRGVLVLGQRKQYESTFQLVKGWDESLETARWRDFVRSRADNWPKVADVYRKWVLNEHGWYSGSPWNLSVHSFSNISAEDFTIPTARAFLPCLSTDRQGRSLGVVVEIRCGQQGPWRRWRGPLWVAGDECAIYLGGDALPGEFFQAASDDDVSLRLTAAVEADARLIAEVEGNPNLAREVVDLSGRAAWRQVHSSSIFKSADGVGPPAERDDGDLLNHLAQRHADTESTATEAEFTLASIDTSFHVGDIVERVDGRAFELSSNPAGRPHVRSIRHDFGTTQTTHLLVSG